MLHGWVVSFPRKERVKQIPPSAREAISVTWHTVDGAGLVDGAELFLLLDPSCPTFN